MTKKHISPKTRTALIVLGALLLLAVLLLGGILRAGSPGGANGSTAEDRARYLSELGWVIDPETESFEEVRIPAAFSSAYERYNELQLQQGFDLADYRGKCCGRYSYEVTNWPDKNQHVLADLFVYEGRVIGGDVHSTNLDGFMVGLK